MVDVASRVDIVKDGKEMSVLPIDAREHLQHGWRLKSGQSLHGIQIPLARLVPSHAPGAEPAARAKPEESAKVPSDPPGGEEESGTVHRASGVVGEANLPKVAESRPRVTKV